MKITWVNHASYILEHEDVRLISDPWIEGRVFNESWSLLLDSVFTYEDFHSITHIWFSHEHPDHFFPPNLKQIPLEARRNITVLFQETMDHKVVEFCRKMEFKAMIELKGGKTYSLGKDFTVVNGKVSNDTDSWLYLEVGGKRILNLNDCVFHRDELQPLVQRFTDVDVLLTQFSFANWIGNEDDPETCKKAAERKRQEISKHVQLFKPKYTIPFASYVWFCNEANFYMNQYANSIQETVTLIEREGSRPIVMAPGNQWDFETAYSNDEPINSYSKAISSLADRQLTHFDSVPLSQLEKVAHDFVTKALNLNNRSKLLGYSPMTIHLSDLDEVISISYKDGMKKSTESKENADISFHSQNLEYCLKFDWGFDTILIAGTFQKPNGGNFQHFMEYEWVATLNNQGKRMKGIVGRAIDKLMK